MEYEIGNLDGGARAAEKQASRDDDAKRLASGEISAAALRRKNSFFGSLAFSKFRIVAIGGKPIRQTGND
jgi:hypothetical protein